MRVFVAKRYAGRHVEERSRSQLHECFVDATFSVSTRKVDRRMCTLGIDGISRSRVSDIAHSPDKTVKAFRTLLLDGARRPCSWSAPCSPSSTTSGRSHDATPASRWSISQVVTREPSKLTEETFNLTA